MDMKNFIVEGHGVAWEYTEKGKFQSKFGGMKFYKYAHKIHKNTPNY